MNLRKVIWTLAVTAVCLLPLAGSFGCTPPSDTGSGGGGGTNTTSAESNTTNT
jgi:hypothetical protein